jgi:hypothetical protein
VGRPRGQRQHPCHIDGISRRDRPTAQTEQPGHSVGRPYLPNRGGFIPPVGSS